MQQELQNRLLLLYDGSSFRKEVRPPQLPSAEVGHTLCKLVSLLATLGQCSKADDMRIITPAFGQMNTAS